MYQFNKKCEVCESKTLILYKRTAFKVLLTGKNILCIGAFMSA